MTASDPVDGIGASVGIPNNDKTHKNQRHNSPATSGAKTNATKVHSLRKKMAKEAEYNFTM